MAGRQLNRQQLTLLHYIGQSNTRQISRIRDFCAVTQPDEILQCMFNTGPTVPVPPVPGKMKTVFFLNLSTSTNLSIQQTANYYWNNYPQEFTSCPIVDNAGSTVLTLELLEEYYNYGFRFFVSFQTSNLVRDCLEWFNSHPDATGISPTSNADYLAIPKNIYRLTPNNQYVIDSINTPIMDAIDASATVYYIYTIGQSVSIDALNVLNTIVPASQLKTLPTLRFITPENLQEVETFLANPITNSILILLSDYRTEFLNLFNQGLTFSEDIYDILTSRQPTIPTGQAQTELANKYYITISAGVNTSILWRNGLYTLGLTNYSTVTLNVLQLLNQLTNNETVDNINSHYGSLIFDPVTKDILYPNILLRLYTTGNTFINSSLYSEDPYIGNYFATSVSLYTPPTTIIPISPNKTSYGTVIALLEPNYGNQRDGIINESLYYFWYKDATLPKFPIEIINDITPTQLADLLTTYYNQGVRYFLGPNYAHLLNTPAILNWFRTHLDAICITLFTASVSPTTPGNIYYTQYPAFTIIDLFSEQIDTSDKIYYIYEANEPTGIAINNYLQQTYGGTHTYTSFSVDASGTNLTVSNMLDFFGFDPSNNPATPADIIIIYTPSNIQTYLNLYNNSSMNVINTPQYIAFTDTTIMVPSSLNQKLYMLQTTQVNTSKLWNENRIYLSNKYSSDVISGQLINALKMIQYFLKGKDIKLLGSHSGVVQFNSQGVIQYPSMLIKQYQSASNTFVNNQIVFQDPVLGKFSANFD
jgi:hypothetical protein